MGLKGNKEVREKDRKATRHFLIQAILTKYCGQILTPNKVEEIAYDLKKEIDEGCCGWAFK